MIVLVVRWYLRMGLPYRDVEEFLAERGVEADRVTVYRWVVRFTEPLATATGTLVRAYRNWSGVRRLIQPRVLLARGGVAMQRVLADPPQAHDQRARPLRDARTDHG